MIAPASVSDSSWVKPLFRGELFAPGAAMSPDDLVRRALSLFWRECCARPDASFAPMPALELGGDAFAGAGVIKPLRAWWLLDEGIRAEDDGPHPAGLRGFFGVARTGRLWPRYTFRLVPAPLAVELNFARDPRAIWGYRTRLVNLPDGRVRVSDGEPSSARLRGQLADFGA